MFEYLLRALFILFIGVLSRYLFYLVIGKKKTLRNLLGRGMDDDQTRLQNFYNTIVGIVIGFFLIILILYIIFS